MSNGLDHLATASSLMDTLKEMQEGMRAFREDINCLKTNAPPSQESSVVTPRNSDQDPAQRIPDILDPILDDQHVNEACVVEVSPWTGACIMASFCSYTTEKEEHFTAQGPMLFRNEFMNNVTEHWKQVKALWKMWDRPSISGFQKAYSCLGKEDSVSLEDTVQQRGTSVPKVQK